MTQACSRCTQRQRPLSWNGKNTCRALLLALVMAFFLSPVDAATRAFGRLAARKLAPPNMHPAPRFDQQQQIHQIFYGQTSHWDASATTATQASGSSSGSNSRSNSRANSAARESAPTLRRSLSFSSAEVKSQELATLYSRARALRYVQREVDPRLL